MILTFYKPVVKVGERWVVQEFVLLIAAGLPNGTGLPNEQISYWISIIYVVIKSEFSKFPKKSLTWSLSSSRCKFS